MERDIQSEVARAWGAHPRLRIARTNTGVGWYAHGKPARKTDPGAYPVKFGVPGTGDLVGLIAPEGRLLMIELKSATGRQRDAQIVMQRVIEQFGGVYILARSLNDVDEALAALGLYR